MTSISSSLPPKICAVCSITRQQLRETDPNATLKKCSACFSVRYCGNDHQKAHWPQHKFECHTLRNRLIESIDAHMDTALDEMQVIYADRVLNPTENGGLETSLKQEKDALLDVMQDTKFVIKVSQQTMPKKEMANLQTRINNLEAGLARVNRQIEQLKK